MPAETGRALLILVVFVLPGFVTLVFKERMHEIRREDSPFERLFSAILYSLIVYAPLAVLGAIIGLDRQDIIKIYSAREGLWPLVAVGVLSGLLIPALVAYSSHRWQGSDLRTNVLTRLKIPTAHGVPTAWDYFFGHRLPALVRVTLSTGEVVGGFISNFSFAAYSAHGRDLYIQEQWEIDGQTFALLGPVRGSMGIWLPGPHIIEVEIFAVEAEHEALFKELGLAGLLEEITEDEESADGEQP